MLKLIPIEDLYTTSNIRNEQDDEIRELAESIQEHGLIEPLAVKEKDHNGHYEIIAGHRRFLALQMIHEPVIECNIIEDVDSLEKTVLQIAENTQRKEMSAWELCTIFDQLKSQKGYTDAMIAKTFNKNVSWVRNNYSAKHFLEVEYANGDIPEEKKKLPQSVIRTAHKRKSTGETVSSFYKGFSVTRRGHNYMVYINDYAVEQELNKFFEKYL